MEEDSWVSGLIYWMKWDRNKAQGRDHKEAVGFDGEEESANLS